MSDSLRRLARRAEFDRAVLYALAGRGWPVVSGPVTVLLIVAHFTERTQGFYYAFGSLLVLQSLFELSLAGVLLNAASHEWAGLRTGEDGGVEGDPTAQARLADLYRLGQWCHRAAAAVFALAVGIAGWLMFENRGGTDWHGPWLAAVATTAGSMALLPHLALLNGAHRVTAVNRVGVLAAVTASVATWSCIATGLGLWAVPAAGATRLAWELRLIRFESGTFFRSLARVSERSTLCWRTEVWPLQWRMALHAGSAAIAAASFTVSQFTLQSEAAAGRMGMTWVLLNTLLFGGLSWFQTRIPTLAGYAAREDRAGYDRIFFRIAFVTLTAVIAGGALLWLGVVVLESSELSLRGRRLTDRLLPPFPTGFLIVGMIAQHAVNCLVIYARTQKQEPFVVLNVASGLVVAAAVWLLTPQFGATGAAAGYAVVVAAGILPATSIAWHRFRERRP